MRRMNGLISGWNSKYLALGRHCSSTVSRFWRTRSSFNIIGSAKDLRTPSQTGSSSQSRLRERSSSAFTLAALILWTSQRNIRASSAMLGDRPAVMYHVFCSNYQLPSKSFRTFSSSNSIEGISHAHMVVWEGCKGDRQSQWGMAKFDTSNDAKPRNRSSPNLKHVITSGISSSKKIWAQSAQGILPPYTRNIHPKPSNVYFTIFSSSEALQRRPLDRFSRLIRHTTWFCARKCLLGWEKLISKFNRFIRKIRKIYNGAYGEILTKFLAVITLVVCKIES